MPIRVTYRQDANQGEIMDALRSLGWYVENTARVGAAAIPGFPDLMLVWPGSPEIWALVEVKMPGNEKRLTKDERAFCERVPKRVEIVSTVDDCIELTRRYTSGKGKS